MAVITPAAIYVPGQGSVTPGGAQGVAWGCGTCPDFILGTLVNDCQNTLYRVQRIKKLVTIVNDLAASLTQQALDDLRRLLGMIPNPPLLDFQQIIAMLTCPLTPQSLVIGEVDKWMSNAIQKAATIPNPARYGAVGGFFKDEFLKFVAEINPTYQSIYGDIEKLLKEKIVEPIKAFGRQIEKMIDSFLETLDGSAYLRIIMRVWRDLYEQALSTDVLALSLAITSASVAGVRATCPEVFKREDLPFARFVSEVSTFSFNGVIPSGLEGLAVQLATILAEIQGKLLLWQSIPLVLL